MSTALFVPIADQQGAALGLGGGAVAGTVDGTYGYAEQMAAYGMKWIVEQTQVPLMLDASAEGTPRGIAAADVDVVVQTDSDVMIGIFGSAAVPLIVDTDATGTPRGQAASSVPIKIAASSTARGRVTAAVQAVIKWAIASAARPRVIAQALVRVVFRPAAAAMPRVIAQTSVPFPIKWLASSFAKQPPRVVRILQNLSRTVVGPAKDRSQPSVRVRDDSEA